MWRITLIRKSAATSMSTYRCILRPCINLGVNCLFGGNQETPDSLSFGEMQRSTCQSTNERFLDGTAEQVVKCTSTVFGEDLIMGQFNKQISTCSGKTQLFRLVQLIHNTIFLNDTNDNYEYRKHQL